MNGGCDSSGLIALARDVGACLEDKDEIARVEVAITIPIL